MTLNSLRSVLYAAARILGDLNAILKGRILQRLERRAVYRMTSRIIRKLLP